MLPNTTRHRRRWAAPVMAVAAAALLALSGCASQAGDGSGGAPQSGAQEVSTGLVNVQRGAGDPVDGGTLTFASFAPVASLDPTVTRPDGASGGTELAAVYDVLARYDYASGKFVPQLAESITANDDATVWTVTLREGVTFSDGTPLDAQAVVASIKRYNSQRGANAELYTDRVASTVATDPATVTITLKAPWPEFPALLANGHGMIVAPAAYAGATFTPIGAGPYTVGHLAPQQKLTLVARTDYWGGKPHLDKIDFVALADDDARISTLANGGADVAYLFHPKEAGEQSAKTPGFLRTDALGSVGQINNAPGRPGADPRVRKAVALAVDPAVIDERVDAGAGLPGTTMFPQWSRWHTGTAGVTPDEAEAAELLEQAKADGYDGHLTYVGVNAPSGQQRAVAVQAMLDAVGFDVTIDYVNNATDLVRRLYAEHDFDISYSSYNVSEAAPGVRLYGALRSDSAANISAYTSPKMDALLDKVLAAPDTATKTAALEEIQQRVNADQPFAVWGANRSFVSWNTDVHGIVPTDNGIMLLDSAWKK
ncbi:ABC transporter substrate-binding protein [Tomitella gaofuii]|uniref:ABC transporter substrate-binding protein n=1 Tax=Tomitella gaofuii TaxID=2760083 RepID=UPI001F1B3652|nr:ABC transporter substrate-binding protein [Tomitella gaofuii]